MDYYKMSLEDLDRLMVTEYKQEIAKLQKLIPTWTKFNHNDTKTFPTKNGKYLVVFFDEIRIADWWNEYQHFSTVEMKPFNDCVFYWMPLPEMPNKK